MFPFEIRAYVNDNMYYINDFHVTLDDKLQKRTFSFKIDENDEKTDIYMMKTNGFALNGCIYEYDIIQSDDGRAFIVYFDTQNGKFVGVNGTMTIDILADMSLFEIIGNPLDTPKMLELIDYSAIKDETSFLIEHYAKKTSKIEDDCTMDVIESVTVDEVDFEENEESLSDMIGLEDGIDMDKTLDEGTIVIDYSQGDITDEYVDWVYRMYDIAHNVSSIEELNYDDCIYIYAEGVYNDKTSKSAYSFTVEWAGYIQEYKGIIKKSVSQNSAELQSIIRSVSCVVDPSQIKVVSSSKYALFPFTKGWIYEWEKNGWKKKDTGENIKNCNLFQKLLTETKKHAIDFMLIKDRKDNATLQGCYSSAMALTCV